MQTINAFYFQAPHPENFVKGEAITMSERVAEAWLALRQQIEMCCAELKEEVRTYPTPIAACDVQLTKLVEDCHMAFGWLRIAGELDRQRATLSRRAWHTQLRRFALDMPTVQHQALASARDGVIAAAVGSRP